MNLEEFEAQYRSSIEVTLKQLQTVVLLVAQLEARVVDIGRDLQDLSLSVEEFIIQQRSK